MEADEFFAEVNRVPGFQLQPAEFDYRCEDDPSPPPTGGTVAVITPLFQTVTIKYIPTAVVREYRAGHGSTFPVEFIDDWKAGLFEAAA